MKTSLLAVALCAATYSFATPVSVEWKSPETMPASVARPFAGFLPDGRFLVAGGTDFVQTEDGLGEINTAKFPRTSAFFTSKTTETATCSFVSAIPDARNVPAGLAALCAQSHEFP